MAPKSSLMIGGLAIVAATICVLPVARGTDASMGNASVEQAPVVAVNRDAKSDRIVSDRLISERMMPASDAPASMSVNRKNVPADPAPTMRSESDDHGELLDGCEPAFSPVTMPAMAHFASRCIG